MGARYRISLLLASVITLCQILSVAVAQPCTVGFPSTVSQCCDDGPRQAVTRIIPDMNFNCAGTIVQWTAAGTIDTRRSINAMLGIWRERRNESRTYDRVGRIELGICGNETEAPLVMVMSNVYRCTLPQSKKVSVQPGDVIGVEIASNNNYRFRLYFTTGGGPTNYQFSGHISTAILGTGHSSDQPQISLSVEPTIVTTTVQSPTTTEASTTAMATETQSSMAIAMTTTAGSTAGSTTEIPPTTNAQATTTSMENAPTTIENAASPVMSTLTSTDNNYYIC